MKIPEAEIRFIGSKNEQYSRKIVYATIDECYEYCSQHSILAIDIETTRKYRLNTYRNENVYQPGLDPFLSAIVMLQIGTKERVYVIDTRTVDIEPLKPLFSDKSRLWVGANLRFEAKHLLHNYGILFWYICDVMLQEQNLTNGLGKSKTNPKGFSYSLEAIANRYLGVAAVQEKDLFTEDTGEEDTEQLYIDKRIRKGFLTIRDTPFTESQILYGADDIIYPLYIRDKQLKGFRGYNPVVVHQLENEFCLVLADIELKGMEFDKEQWLRTYEKNLVIYNHRKKKLDDWVVANHRTFCTPPDMFRAEYTCSIQWTSSKQVIELFRHLGFCPMEKSKQTGKMEYTAGAKSLTKLLDGPYKERYNDDKETDIIEEKDLILNYLLFKVSEQCVTTFGKDWLKHIHPITGRVHTSYKQILNTGRVSSRGPNLQNVPSDSDYRKAFTAAAGCKIVNCDYSSQEARIIADVSGDESMLRFFNEGDPVHGSDMHSMTATKMFRVLRKDPNLLISKKTHPKERNDAKSLGFKIVYGGGADTLKDDLGVDKETAQKFIDSYLEAFPGLKQYFDDSHKAAMETGYIEIDSITNRRYWEPDYERMLDAKRKIDELIPKDYQKMKYHDRQTAKEQLEKEHPEIKDLWKLFFIIKGSLERCSQNYKIQGLAGSQTKTFGVLFRKYQIEHNLRDKIYLTNLIHDESMAEVKEEYGEQGRQLIETLMKVGAQMYCSKVKMDAEGVLTTYWNH
jgi:DNA polymerase I-like protein with 3'-5' exonuclease and polymerase domains